MKALAFLISLSLLVVTHELGHLFFAKLFHTRAGYRWAATATSQG